MMSFMRRLTGLNFTMDRTAKSRPNGIAMTRVSAKSFSVTPKPTHRSYRTDHVFIKINCFLT
jgi:hypothetical protein